MAVRAEREKGVLDALMQVEKSHVPFPDDPPIVYPDAELWQQLTARRKERYSSVDLAKQGTSEKNIQDALKQPTQMEFTDQPLNDVIDYLKDYHSQLLQRPIEIQLDTKALNDAGIAPDHAGDEEPQGDYLAVGPETAAQRLAADVHHPKRSAADYHAGGGRKPS